MGSLNLWFYWNFLEAERNYKKACELNPAVPLTSYTEFLLPMGRYSEAIEKVKKIVKTNPYSGSSWVTQGLCYHILVERVKAEESIDNALIKNEANIFVFGDIFRILVYNGKYEKLLELFRKLDGDQYNPRLMGISGLAYLHTGRDDEVTKIIKILNEQSNI